MEIFEKIGQAATDAYNVAADKTSRLAREAKLRMKMNEKKSDINDIYKQIGKKVYEEHIRENFDAKIELEEECAKIDTISKEIEEMLKELLELKDRKKCEECHIEIEKDSKYCPECGAKQVIVEVKEEPQQETEILEDETEGGEMFYDETVE